MDVDLIIQTFKPVTTILKENHEPTVAHASEYLLISVAMRPSTPLNGISTEF